MFLSWSAGEGFEYNECKKYILENGRSCLLWARGYFFDPKGRFWYGVEISEWLAGELKTHGLSDFLSKMNGCFSIVIVWLDTEVIEVGTDRFGTVPLYSYYDDKKLFLSDNFWDVVPYVNTKEYDRNAIVSMVIFGYITEYRTLLSKIIELAQASIYLFSLSESVVQVSRKQYWSLTYTPQKKRRMWTEELEDMINIVFTRFAQAVLERKWDLIVPLSGGLDSRLLLSMLSRTDLSTMAFSYGPTANQDSVSASLVAKFLNIPFHFVPIDDFVWLTPEFIQARTKDVGMRVRFTSALGAQLSLSSFSDKDVFAPGHTGDFISGGHLRRDAHLIRSEKQAVQHLINNHSLPIFDEMLSDLFPGFQPDQDKKFLIGKDWQFNVTDPISSLERWNLENRQRRLILSELRTYEKFGRWIIPFYDYELFDFFAKVPHHLRFKQHLYIKTWSLAKKWIS